MRSRMTGKAMTTPLHNSPVTTNPRIRTASSIDRTQGRGHTLAMTHAIDRRSILAGLPLLATTADAIARPPAAASSSVSKEGTIDVRAYGAIGDGVTDDTAAIQSAIDALADRGGGTVRLSHGVYGCRLRPARSISPDPLGLTCLRMRSGVSLRGDGAASVLRLLADDPLIGPGSYMRMLMSDGRLTSVTLADFTIDFNIARQSGYRSDGERDRANGGCILLGGGGSGTASVADIDIRGIRLVNGFGQAIQISGHPGHLCDGIRIADCLIADSKYIGIQVSHARDVQIVGNRITDTRDNAIDIYGDDTTAVTTTRGVVVQRNTIARCLRGVFVETSSFALVTDNVIADCADSGIQVNRIVGEPRGVLVCDNVVTGGVCGSRVAGECDGVILRGNMIADFRDAGIQLGGTRLSISYVMVEDNVLLPGKAADAMIRILPGTIGANFLLLGTNYLTSADAARPVTRSQWLVDQGVAGGPRTGNRAPVFVGFAEHDGPDLSCRWASVSRLAVDGTARIAALALEGALRFDPLPPLAAGNAQAAAVGIAVGQVYRTPTGQLMIRS